MHLILGLIFYVFGGAICFAAMLFAAAFFSALVEGYIQR